MSVFQTQTMQLPGVRHAVPFKLAFSVNADRRPDLRDAIVAGTFQRQPCPSCGSRIPGRPQIHLHGLRHGLYIGVWPVAKRGQWQAWAARRAETFEEGLGKRRSPEARQARRGSSRPRAVFGWPALAEKIIARQAGIDDRTLELAKVDGAAPRQRDADPRASASFAWSRPVPRGTSVLAWVRAGRRPGSSRRCACRAR